MKSLLVAAALSAAALAPVAADAQDARYGKQKVVYHINYDGGQDDRAYRVALNNIQNHINAVGAENMEIAVVLHGDGVGLLAHALDNEALRQNVTGLKSQNVGFQVCNNTLVGRKIDPDADLFDVWDEDIVPSGVAELSRLQMMGYTYIKP